MNCVLCQTEFKKGSHNAKFCSISCKNKFHQNNCYKNQKERGMKRKIELVKFMGGKCESCGYDKNYASLCFHHKNPDDKIFNVDMRHCSNRSMISLRKELSKCQLLCHNCHNEHHHPTYAKE